MFPRCTAAATLAGFSLFLMASPALTDPTPPADTTPVINGVFDSGNDFFDEGIEQFDQEIERLLARQTDPSQLTLTVDPALQFNPELFEDQEESPATPQESQTPL